LAGISVGCDLMKSDLLPNAAFAAAGGVEREALREAFFLRVVLVFFAMVQPIYQLRIVMEAFCGKI
jgi:hypothetical protein